MSSYERLLQQKKWRESKAKWRAKVRKKRPPEGQLGRRDPRSKLSIKEEGVLLVDFLLGCSYEDLEVKYSVSNRTISKILSYWRSKCEDRFRNLSPKGDSGEESQQDEDVPSDGFF